jgi:hypothetical protein
LTDPADTTAAAEMLAFKASSFSGATMPGSAKRINPL